MKTLDLRELNIRDVNFALQKKSSSKQESWEVLNPRGCHALAVGLENRSKVFVRGSTGYYCGGMNKNSDIIIEGSAGPGVAENIMSGSVTVKGDASQYAGATGRGGLLIIEGNASSRCGISMKGVDIIVKGNVGHMSCFMGQSGNLVVFGDAGESLGDSIYEARIFVRGKVSSLGADCVEKTMSTEDISILQALLSKSNSPAKPEQFRRYGSARKLYNFNIDNASDY